jgi:hypothetical protein
LKTRSRPGNEKSGNEKPNSRFTLKSPMSAGSVLSGIYKGFSAFSSLDSKQNT